MKKVKRWRENKVKESKVMLTTFTEKGNDFTTMERTKMIKWLYYYKTGGVENYSQ